MLFWGPTPQSLSLEGGGGYESGSGGAVDPSSQLTYQAVSVSLNSWVLNKTVPGPRGGDTWGVPAAPDFPAVESGNGGERGGLATWTSGNPRAHGFQQNTSSGMTVNLGFQIRGTQTFNI